jgi:hypothetical protein
MENDVKRYPLALMSLATLLSISAHAAGSLSTATIETVTVDSNGFGLVKFTQPIAGTPPSSCVIPGYASALAFDTNTAGGRSLLAVLLIAKASGSTLDVGGKGACGVYPGQIEDLSYAVEH